MDSTHPIPTTPTPTTIIIPPSSSSLSLVSSHNHTKIQFHYVIASYSGMIETRKQDLFAGDELNRQLSLLHSILVKKKAQNMETILSRVTVVCPDVPSSKPSYHGYYQRETWTRAFHYIGIPIVFLQYTGQNKHHSYDQWIQAYMSFPEADYHLFMEDDYCISPTCLTFDTDLVSLYKKRFPASPSIGYLPSLFCTLEQQFGDHAAISNGLVSRETFMYLETEASRQGMPPVCLPTTVFPQSSSPSRILSLFMSMTTRVSFNICPQLMFSYMFSFHNVPCSDFRPEYKIPFWISSERKMKDYNPTSTSNQCIIIPLQLVCQS